MDTGKVVSLISWNALFWACALGVILFGLGMYVYFGFGPWGILAVGSIDPHVDFYTFWRSAQALWEGTDIYATGVEVTNLNPPFFIVLFWPFGLLEPMVAYRVFVMLALLTSIGYLAWAAAELKLRTGWAVVGVVMLLLSVSFETTLSLGQIYPFLALVLVVAWVADRHEKPLIAGIALGLVVAVKPPLAPVLLWPLLRRRWGMLRIALGAGIAATIVGIVVAGPEATLEWLGLLTNVELQGSWYNASLPGAASRLFTESRYAVPIVTLPWAISAAYVVGILGVIFTAWKVRWDKELGLWALVAASILVSPVGWYDYVVLLGPGVLVLLARGRVALGLLLLALVDIPGQWILLWQDQTTSVAALALTLYSFILVAYWLALVWIAKEPSRALKPALKSKKPTVKAGEMAAVSGARG